jgi:hypothetical protein
MLSRVRARAIGLFALLWAGASGVIGLGIVLRPLIRYPSLIRAESILDGLRYVATSMAIGAICGVAFSLFLLAFARRRPLGKLAVIPVTAPVAALAFLVGAITDGSKAATGLAAVAATLAAITLWLATRPATASHPSAEQAT